MNTLYQDLYHEWKAIYFDSWKEETLEHLQDIFTDLAAQIAADTPESEASMKMLKDSYDATIAFMDLMAMNTARLAEQVVFPPISRRGRPRNGCKFCN